MSTLSVIGIVLGLAVLCFLCVKSVNVFIATIAASAVVILFSGLPLGATLVETYSSGFASFITGNFFRYIWGTCFGILMEKCGAAHSVANGIIKVFGRRFALLALPLASGALAYAGMSGTVSLFVCLPIYLRVFKECDFPRRYIPGLFLYSTGTFINSAPGSAQNLNILATRAVGLEPSAGLLVGVIGSVVVFVLGMGYTFYAVNKSKKNGEHYIELEGHSIEDPTIEHPPFLLAILPMIIVVFFINFKLNGAALVSVETAVFLGCLSVPIILFKYANHKTLMEQMGTGAGNAFKMLGTTCAMTGFGVVVMATPGYTAVTDFAMSIDVSPLITLTIAVSLVCACTASATSSIGIIGPTLGQTFVNMGLAPEAVARVMAIAATGFDNVPHNATMVVIINDYCKESWKGSYPYILVTNVLVPLIGTAVTIAACLVIY